MPAPAKFISYIDAHKDAFIARLGEAVAIPSVSGDPSHRPDVIKMASYIKSLLEPLGVKVELKDVGMEKQPDGTELPLPPVVFGTLGADPKKKTVLLYAHYDVQPALVSDGWNTDPFTLTPDKEGRLFGRGSTDDKGPLIAWINIVEAHVKQGIELPVNIKFCLEGMEESGSEGLDDLIEKEKDGFFKSCDCVCICDNYWMNDRTPCLTYGVRGMSYYRIIVSGPARDLHSGLFGNTVHEPMTDLILLMSKLVTPSGEIMIPGLDKLVAPLTDAEKKRYETIDFALSDIEEQVGAKIVLSDDKPRVLMGRMRNPSLSLHGIEGAFYGPGAKTVIPAKVQGKFSIRLVPNMTPENVDPLVIKYLSDEFAKLKTKSTLKIENIHGGKAWVADPDHWNFRAAIKATEEVYKKKPDLTREGGSIPVTLTFADVLGLNVLLLPMGRGDDGAHSTNEKLDTYNYIEGTKLLGTYLYEVAVTN
ncbi:CNDP dipeptidase [Calocera cornea HHB12733]|uniref:CNDP dipeptidase n=1 Tax=Calocera cornea HHB12733 TaxID=1353952 RepID=A0A165HG76_9BASI|nr:CNDP dipeptidase [Calocera cornea HHB12733]